MSIDYISLCADHSERIAALETQRETQKAAIQDIYDKLDRMKTQHESNWARIVKLEEANSSAGLTGSPAPAGGLVERVAEAIGVISTTQVTARAAILAVAEWLDTRGQHGCSLWLREEAER